MRFDWLASARASRVTAKYWPRRSGSLPWLRIHALGRQRPAGSPLPATRGSSGPSVLEMVWFQVNIPLVVGCLLMAALMDLRVFKLCLAFASILLVFLGAGVIVFGTKLGMIPANAVPILSVMVWLGCVGSVIRRWFRSKRPCEQ